MIHFNQSTPQKFLLPTRSCSVIYIIPNMLYCIQTDQLMCYIWTTGVALNNLNAFNYESWPVIAILQNSRGKHSVLHTGEQAIKCLDRFQHKQWLRNANATIKDYHAAKTTATKSYFNDAVKEYTGPLTNDSIWSTGEVTLTAEKINTPKNTCPSATFIL